MFSLAIKESLDRKFKRLRMKDKEMLRLIETKVNDILADPYRFKPLRKPMQKKRLPANRPIGA
jgi:mRNA-degrading endonuclease RelE of RelBE toxin-antitoxin system